MSMHDLRRRIALLSKALLAALLAGVLAMPGYAQQPERLPTVGLLFLAGEQEFRPIIEAVKEGLKEYGLVDGKTIRLVIVSADGKPERLPDLVRVLVAEGARVIVTSGTTSVSAAHRGAPNTPIVMSGSADPVMMGFARSLARPGGNVTGLSILGEEILTKQIQLLKETVPTARAVVAFLHPANPGNAEFRRIFSNAGRSLGVRIEARDIATKQDITTALDDAVRQSADGVQVIQDAFFIGHQELLFRQAIERRLPTVTASVDFAHSGALMSYALDFPAIARQSGRYVSKILTGADPATLPIEQPTAVRLVVNLRTAKLIGVTIPPSLLARADEAIE